jgi:hypothetical protein
MKKKLSLPSFLRAFFNVLYIFIAIVTALMVVILLTGGLTALGRDGRGHLNLPMLHDISLTVRGKAVTAQTSTSSARDIEVTDIVTSLGVNAFSQDPELASAARWTLLPQLAGIMVGGLMICRLLRDLCARIEKGEVFSEENLRLVRNIGFLYVAFSLFEFIAHGCSLYFLGGYLARHAKLSGIEGTFDASLSNLPLIPDGLIDGLIILLLAEAFRQGLALKKENDLTV